jgi:hypothetical protein
VQRCVQTEITQSRCTRTRITTLLAFVAHLHYRRRLDSLQISSSSGPLQRCEETQSDDATAMGMGGHALQPRGPNCDVEGSAACFRCPQIIQMYVDPALIGLDSSLIRTTDIGTLLCTTIIRTSSGARRVSAQHRHAKERGSGVHVTFSNRGARATMSRYVCFRCKRTASSLNASLESIPHYRHCSAIHCVPQ